MCDENLIAVHMKKTTLYFNEPVYLGMIIVDLSKSLMYDFHYNYINTKYGDRQNYSSLTLTLSHMKLRPQFFYKDINPDIEKRFDTSHYPINHPSGIKMGLNSKVLDMFKDEVGGKQIVEFVGLRAKLYSYKCLMALKIKKNVRR